MVKKGNITEAELARQLNITLCNVNQKMKHYNFLEQDLQQIGNVLGCDVKIEFVDRQTGDVT